MVIHIDNQQDLVLIDKARLRSRIKRILDALASEPLELSVVLMDDAAITQLNKQYLNRPGPTNVIAFSMREGPFAEIQSQLLGDVAVSVETALREAEQAGQGVYERIEFLLIHGILHLFGFDHEHDDAQARVMDAKTRELAGLLRDVRGNPF